MTTMSGIQGGQRLPESLPAGAMFVSEEGMIVE